MDRPTTRKDADARTMRLDLPEAFLPPSRVAALELGRAALLAGPVLVTGDAGIGKTWMVGRWTQLDATCRWVEIDLTPADGPADLYRQLARGLGIAAQAPSRLDVADALAERDADGERHSLVIDEAHNLAPAVWEEVRVLTNRLGQPDGWDRLILAGQTPLVRRFSTRPLAAVGARLAAHVHLRPIEVVEAVQWFGQRHPGLERSGGELEVLHRDAGGNPGRLLRHFAALAARGPTRPELGHAPGRGIADRREATVDAVPAPTIAGRTLRPRPLGGDVRPPLHVEENAIEVGWAADDGDLPDADEGDGDPQALGPAAETTPRLEESDQAVHDHYAALQAWREWADNQEKQFVPARSDRALADAIDEAAAAEASDPAEAIGVERSSLRAEGHQHFAPFGQLFARMPPAREPGTTRS